MENHTGHVYQLLVKTQFETVINVYNAVSKYKTEDGTEGTNKFMNKFVFFLFLIETMSVVLALTHVRLYTC